MFLLKKWGERQKECVFGEKVFNFRYQYAREYATMKKKREDIRMNEILRCMEERRSCRAYSERTPEPALLEAVLRAATYAPTGRNLQSPKIIVTSEPETVAKLRRLNAAVLGTDGDPFYGAPTVVSVLADSSVPTWVEDGSLVIGNLLLAAHAVGLAGCWIHRAREVFDSPEGRALLDGWGVSPVYRGVGHCILGYRDDAVPEARPRKADYIFHI